VRISLLAYCFSLIAALPLSHAVFADDGLSAARADVRRDLAVAKAEARHYWQVEYRQQLQDLNAAIDMTDAEISATRAQWRQYELSDQSTVYQPVLLPLYGMRGCLLDAELRLDRLRQQRDDLIRFHSCEGDLLQQRVADIRARLVELEGGETIEISNPQ
jgi:hypothetical protein